jgi:simple sugar transport system substrate-binding protein
VAEGTASFAVDQQPFLQGYLPVQYLALLARDGVIPVATVNTGPRLLSAADAAKRLAKVEPKTE